MNEGETLASLPAGERMAAFAESRRLVAETVAGLFSIPAACLAVPGSDRSQADAFRAMYQDAAQPMADLLAGALTRQAVPAFFSGERDHPESISVVADLSDRLRDRQAQRYESYQRALGDATHPGWLSVGEVRSAEGIDGAVPASD
jgi:hypothetical protein